MQAKVTGTGFMSEWAQAFREDSDEDLWIDQVIFHRQTPLPSDQMDAIPYLRMPQSQPSGAFMESITVTGTYPTFDIELTPHDCGYDFPLFQAGPGLPVSVSRQQAASPPIAGSYAVSFNGDTTPDQVAVSVKVEPENLIGGLSSMSVGFSEVEATGTCSAFTFRVKMVSLSGNQNMMEVDSTRLTGDGVTVTVESIQDGGVWFDPIMGSLLRTHHTSPQVQASINNVPTRCRDGTDCSFSWTSALTPTVASIAPTSGSMGASVVITGTGFSSTDADNTVVIGTTACTVTGSTSTSVTCTLNNGPTGPAGVKVTVKDKGLASGAVTFTYVTGVSGLTASPGSVEGGSNITLTGFGFTSDATVSVGGNPCTILSHSESEITCVTSRAASHTTTTSVDVEVTQIGSSVVAGQFTYDNSLTYTPVISSISLTTANVWGGQRITIAGSGFGNTEMPVMLGGEDMVVESYTDTEIVAFTPALSHGNYKLLVQVDDKGYADLRTNAISDISYVFQVTSMSPDFGSLYGGTDLLIIGEGFSSNSSEMEVSLGPHACDITSVTNNQIECRIADTGVTHLISATGTHKNYGYGYAWDKDPHQVNVGDYVTWQWDTPSYVSDIGYSIQQTATASDIVNMPGGFSSGAISRSGSFTQRFTVPGTYYYWTGYMNSAQSIYFRGTINVMPLVSHSQQLSVQLRGQEAQYDTSGSPQAASSACSSVGSSISGCSDSTSLSPVSGKFNFRFLKCYSPYVETISTNNGTVNDVIQFTGKGFGTENCQNEVKFSGATCDTVRSSSSSIEFRIADADSPPVGVLHEFETRVANLGYAIVAISSNADKRFGLLPSVSSLTPFEGSKVGGTKVTISGAGFEGGVGDITVDFYYLECEVESVTYSQIVCETNCLSTPSNCRAGAMTATVMVPVGDASVMAQCEDPSCKFITSDDKTPTVSDITPVTTNAATTSFTITGTGFGTDNSLVTVLLSNETCTLTAPVTDTSITCSAGRLPVGANDVKVYVDGKGRASTTETVASEAVASISQPSASSTHGGAALVITGNGFVNGDTTVDVAGSPCEINSTTFDQVICTLPAKAAGSASVTVTSNGESYSALSLSYSATATPTVSGTNPTNGRSGDQITVQGNYFTSPAGSDPVVTIGGVAARVTAHTTTTITCIAGTQATGEFNVLVFVEQLGFSNNDTMFTYEIGSFSVSPSTGTTNGGQTITLTGSGFLESESAVTVCGADCVEVNVTASQYVCKTPAHAAGACDVVATVRGVSKTNANAYTYDASLVSTVTGVNPTRGGTGGGTLLTISGTNFGSVTGDISVSICGSTCDVQTVSPTSITCRTGTASSSVCQVEVQRGGWGLAEQISAEFEYIDMWSSPYTWGGLDPPTDGDFVVIPEGQKILLDADTAVLTMLLIQGGEVIFDEATIELHAENILITDGGLLQAGTEARPFPKPHTATITMYGHLRSKELPIYGTKTLAVREGTLNLFGTPTLHPWTRLGATAPAGSVDLTLEVNVDWEPGDEIVIATTGDMFSQKESEVRTIQSVSGNVVTLTEPLEYEHIGVQSTYGSRTVHFRAEVGHMTRNVKFRGDRNIAFDTQIEACPKGFNMGEFATQTCFQGRFGDELGSDQFGGCIMVHQAVKDTQVAQAHLSYVELKHVGQAFRMGRYPIHFHLNGNMDQSYVRGCTIRDSFNRAVNIHGTHNTLVEHNVIYNVMGGSFFLEDGDETGNTFQHNLAVFVRSSTSLRNDDITPAAFWATNPNNTIRHNAAAGGTHFGTWYRMHKHPEGPGYDPNYCPQAVPLGEFRNNTAHSLGWFGLWLFESYFPKVAKFYSLTAWNCEKGAESVNSGAQQFHDFVLVSNDLAGYEGKLILDGPQFDEVDGPGVFNSLIVASDPKLRGKSSAGGVVIPYMNGLLIKDVEFYNFDQSGKAAIKWARIDGTCGFLCGGFTTHASGIQLNNSPNVVRYDWESEGVIVDLDGSITGSANHKIVPCTPSLDSNECVANTLTNVNVPACVCSDQIKLIRFSFNNIVPQSLAGHDAVFTSEFGTSFSPFAMKRITHKEGWAMVLMANTYYNFTFENGEQFTNISYDSVMSGFDIGDYLVFTQFAEQKPDRVYLDGASQVSNMSETMLSGPVSHGEWYYSVPDMSMTYAVSRTSRKKRAAVSNIVDTDLKIDARIFRCYYRGCQPPPLPMEVQLDPSHREYWSDPATWVNLTASGVEPVDYEDLTIPIDRWIVVDKPLPRLGKLIIEGGLQFLENSTLDVTLEADYIHITGRMVAGWSEDEPFPGKLHIIIHGHQRSEVFPGVSGAPVGAKFIGVFGGLQLHGVDPGVIRTRLNLTANVGDTTLTVDDVTNWEAGDEILLTTTDYNSWHTETFTIGSVFDNVITLNDSVKFKHLAYSTTVDGTTLEMKAEVALLTRNIKIEGDEYTDSEKESFGTRVLVGQTFYKGEQRAGFGQFSNVEFFHTGQEGFTENYDARFSLTFMDTTSTPGMIMYSFVRRCAFHNGYSTAIGAFAIQGLEIDQNVVHHTVGPGIRVEATDARVTNNLVALSIWPGAYLDRSEPMNIEYEGAIEAIFATGLVLVNNTVAGAERLAYHLPGQACTTADSDLWSNNRATGALVGVGIFPEDVAVDASCVTYNGFTVWKNYDFGFYFNNEANVIIKNNWIIENGVGIFPMVIGPGPVSHAYEDKYCEINNNGFVGKTSSFSYSDDVMPSNDENLLLSSQGRGFGNGVCGKVGFSVGTFTGGSNASPFKPFTNIMSYNTISGRTMVDGNLFANYGSCTGGRDTIITTNPSNEDANHPTYLTNCRWENVETDSKVFFHKESVGKINSADCVDMACDAKKKVMLVDEDGTFLTYPGFVLPESAAEWDGDRRYGLGDYRIPLVMLTTPTGQKIDVNSYAPNKGIYKVDNCTWNSNWRGYDCKDFYDWRQLTIESMDADTETRRISPVAVYSPEGYVDLINGPQDHGWCSGYTCRKRVSTFQAIVALDRVFDIFLSSTNPKTMRFMLMNSNADECVRLSLWSLQQNRLEVDVDGVVVNPKNGYTDANGRFRLNLQNTNHQHMPEVADKINGENYLSRAESTLFWTQCGNSEVTVTRKDVIIVSFTLPAMTDEEFFGEQIVENLAGFLNVDPRKVRVVNIVSDTSSSGRRKRQLQQTTFYVEIADKPGDTPTVDYDTVGKQICNQAQLSTFDDIINATVIYTAIQEPGSPGAQSGQMVTLQKTGQLVMDTVVAGNVQEGNVFSVQPKFKVIDDNNDVVTYLGSYTSDWVMEVSIQSGSSSRARLLGNTTITFVDGWANFTNLYITNRGDYILQFNITDPPSAANYSLVSPTITINGRNLGPYAELKTTNRLVGFPIELEVQLKDEDTNSLITDIEWANLTWTATASIYDLSYYTGTLSGSLTVPFDPSTGKATFLNLQLTKPGKCPVKVVIESDPVEYTVEMVVLVDLLTQQQKNLITEETHTLELKFPINYDSARAPYWTAQVRNYYGVKTNMRITSDGYRKGSLVVTLNIEATSDGYNETITTMCSEIQNGTTFTFDNTTVAMSNYLTVDGVTYYGVSCGDIITTNDGGNGDRSDNDLETVYIVIIVVLSVIVVALLAILLLYKFYFHPKAQTRDVTAAHKGHMKQNMRGDYLIDSLSKEDTFTSLRSRAGSPPMPPVGTAYPNSAAFDLHVQTPGRPLDSPTPRVIRPSAPLDFPPKPPTPEPAFLMRN
ncbi:polycystic kidney and hepatic disease-like 1 [Elysia marginata]|uniref:Polycystic kidney and hepatic disease-like 1 n=1 Tax=Elysia marginata TaxID=1093978 RepID=A0AAV4IN15_9GAST|nr:polycystic kidney and hepatic disease-like 1 [Elysia marginata]